MDKEKYSIIFSSLTGNTKKLADTIRAVLPAEDCDYFGAPKAEELHSEILYIGFWTDKGNADSATLELLSKLRDKKVFLFGTAGFGGSEAYFQKILEHVKQSVGPSNSVFGEYMCQGKMPQSVRDRYMKMKTQPEHPANIDALIENFDRALSHPDEDDLERLRKSFWIDNRTGGFLRQYRTIPALRLKHRGAGALLKNWCAIEKCRRQPFIIKYHKRTAASTASSFYSVLHFTNHSTENSTISS